MNEADREPIVFVALLVKQKGLILPMWLKSMSEWDYPKERMILYIRSNNNTDQTQEVLRDWINENRQYYRLVIEDYKDVVENVEKYGVHEWNAVRFKVLGRIRNESLRIASSTKSDFYWVVDVDNFIKPHTLSKMVSHNLPVVAPFLKCADIDSPAYSNYHFVTDARGYYLDDPRYHQVLRQEIKGLVLCDVVHCTYLIRRDFFEKIRYTDGTNDYEYVIFSRNLRALGVPQYLDNQEIYGFVTLKDDVEASVNALKHLNINDSSSRESVFDEIYKSSAWGEMSGPGSDPAYARYWIDTVNAALSLPGINSVLDIGSGDWRLGSNYILKNKFYTGLEVSKEAIKISEKYTSTGVNFVLGDAEQFAFSKVDLILVKDVLQHLPSKSIQIILDQIFKSCKFALICNDFSNSNADTFDGGWRALNLNEKPFSCNLIEVGSFGEANKMKKLIYLYVADSIKGTDQENELLIRLGLDFKLNG
jgi:ubiquinone/menaquinone biosynthesis C-methylase UbiE